MAEIKCAICFLTREKCKIVVCELVSENPPLPPLKMYAINTLLIIMNQFHWLATNVYVPIIFDVCFLSLQYVYSIILM